MTEFGSVVSEALEQRREYVQAHLLNKLKDDFRTFHSFFQVMYNIPLKKGIIRADPYKNDKKISEINPPADDPVMDSSKEDVVGVRLSDFESQLDFLVSYFQFSLEYLTIARLKALTNLVRFIRWDQFSLNSSKPTTRVFAEMIEKIRLGNDALAAGAVKDAIEQMARLSKSIQSDIAAIALLDREGYKVEFRLKVLPKLIDGVGDANLRGPTGKADYLQAAKRHFRSEMEGRPFYPELITEVFEEEWGANAADEQTALLKKLAVQKVQKKEGPKQDVLKQSLLDGLRVLAAAGRHIDEAVAKLKENSRVVEDRPLTLGERFRRWLEKVTNKEVDQLTYLVEYVDVATAARKTEPIEFAGFCEAALRRARSLSGVLVRGSNLLRKLEQSDEESLFSFLNKNITEFGLITRRLEGLDVYFRAEADRGDKERIRGIGIEITNLKTAMTSVNQKRHDYVSRKEEMEQLRKLGINQ